MNNEKVWTIKRLNESLSDNELIILIKNGTLKADDEIICKELKDFMMIKDSIYQYYLKENKK